jgi:hypothetical protein
MIIEQLLSQIITYDLALFFFSLKHLLMLMKIKKKSLNKLNAKQNKKNYYFLLNMKMKTFLELFDLFFFYNASVVVPTIQFDFQIE